MVFAAYLLENSILVLSRGVAFAPYLNPTVGRLQLLQNKMTNARQMPRGMGTLGIDWAINDPVSGPGEGPAPPYF